ncbi:methyltransferase domain-containing protein [Kitasatospora sp. NPDC101157]|uniref:methyltransferase domain-containing protein n=1 Tax=Kitasatospora sp. NPDC101157 TaxID=3364098 RepID=UPI003826225C
MDDPIWHALPAGTRRTVDEHLAAGRHVHATKAIRDASPESPPGIPACMDVIADRMAELGLLPNGPTPLRAPADGAVAASAAEAYRASREIPIRGLAQWRTAIAAAAPMAPGRRVLDIGAGTGGFAAAFREWFGVHVVAVEPDDAMRRLIPRTTGIEVRDGRAEALPVPDACADAAWLGSVVHHLTDLAAAAAELRRALRPGAPVLVRNAFPGRSAGDIRVRFFPETAAAVEGYPTVEQVCEAFATAGFRRVSLASVPQQNDPTLAEYASRLRREADSKLRALTDAQYEAGLARLRAAVAEDPVQPATSWMDLLVLA